MVKNAISGRSEWLTPPQKVRRRRDSKVSYHSNSTRNTHPNVSGPSMSIAPGNSYSRPNVLIHQQSPPGQPSSRVEFLDLFDFQSSAAGPSSFDASLSPHDQAGNSWLSSSINSSYTLPTRPPNSPQSIATSSSK